MKNKNKSSEHVRPMLEAMARSIDAARAKRTAPEKSAWSGSSEGTTSADANFMIGSPVAENGKAKAQEGQQRERGFHIWATLRISLSPSTFFTLMPSHLYPLPLSSFDYGPMKV